MGKDGREIQSGDYETISTELQICIYVVDYTNFCTETLRFGSQYTQRHIYVLLYREHMMGILRPHMVVSRVKKGGAVGAKTSQSPNYFCNICFGIR